MKKFIGFLFVSLSLLFQASVTHAAPPKDWLYAGEYLRTGEYIVAANRQYFAIMQTDGNFVIYKGSSLADNRGPVWATGTNASNGNPSFAIMQGDGNFVVYRGTSPADNRGFVWATRTDSIPDVKPFLLLSNNGTLTINVNNCRYYEHSPYFLTNADGCIPFANENLALGKPTAQSSTDHGGQSTRAVDGNFNGNYANGSVTHTGNEPEPWWEVDLRENQLVTEVTLYNRTDCCSERLSNFRVELLDVNGNVRDTVVYPGIARRETRLTFRKNFARRVRVTLNSLPDRRNRTLSLAEVVVKGNLALGKPTAQSSTIHGGVSRRAVDGVTGGKFWDFSVTHTDSQFQPYWAVDLMEQRRIDEVVIYNRTDCCSDRLANYKVELLDKNNRVVDSVNVSRTLLSEVVKFNGTPARTVRVQLLGQGVLSLAEVEVYEQYSDLSVAKLMELTATTGAYGKLANIISQTDSLNGIPLQLIPVEIVENSNLSLPEMRFYYRDLKGPATSFNIHMNDKARPSAHEFWYAILQISVETLLGPLPSDQACPGDHPRKLTSPPFDGSESQACQFREAYAEWLTAMMTNHSLQGNEFESAVSEWEPVGAGRRLGGFSDFFNSIFGSFQGVDVYSFQNLEKYKGFDGPIKSIQGCSGTYGSDIDLATCIDHVNDSGFDDQHPLCGVVEVSTGGTLRMKYSKAACDENRHILCQEVSDISGLLSSDIRLTRGEYPVKNADVACILDSALDHSKYYVGYVGDGRDLTILQTAGEFGTEGRCESRFESACTDGQRSAVKRKRSLDVDVAKEIENDKRLKTRKMTVSTLDNEARAGRNFLEFHTLPVGAGACHMVQCIETDPIKRNGEIKSIDALLYDCGSSAKGPNGLSNAGVAMHLLRSGFYRDQSPTVVVSHPDADHFSYIHRIGLDWEGFVEVDEVWLGGDATQRYASYALYDYFNGRDGGQPGPVKTGFRQWLFQPPQATRTINGKYIDGVSQPISLKVTEAWGKHGDFTKTFAACNNARVEKLVVNVENVGVSPNEIGLHRNANSAVLQLKMNDNVVTARPFYHLLLPGDALGVTENQVDFPDANRATVRVMAASHHGSSEHDSNTNIRKFDPNFVVVSAGKKYGHPHEVVIDNYVEGENITANQLQHCLPRGLDHSYYDSFLTDKAVFSTLGSGATVSRVSIPHDKTRGAEHFFFSSVFGACPPVTN